MQSAIRVEKFEEKAVDRVVVQLVDDEPSTNEDCGEEAWYRSLCEEVQLERQKKHCAAYRRHQVFDGFLLGYRIILLFILVWTMAFGCSLLEGW